MHQEKERQTADGRDEAEGSGTPGGNQRYQGDEKLQEHGQAVDRLQMGAATERGIGALQLVGPSGAHHEGEVAADRQAVHGEKAGNHAGGKHVTGKEDSGK